MVRAALKSLGDERCVAFFNEGVVLRDHQANRAQLAWSELERVALIEGGARLELYRRGAATGEPPLVIEMTFMPTSASELRSLLIECARRSGLGVSLKLASQLEQLGVKAGLPQGRG